MFAFLLGSEIFFFFLSNCMKKASPFYSSSWKILRRIERFDMLFKAASTLMPFVCKRIVTKQFDALWPSATLIRWAFLSKVDTHRISLDGRRRIRMKTVTKKSQALMLVTCAENSTYTIVFERFSGDSGKRIKTVVRCVFCDNENEYFWKPVSVYWAQMCQELNYKREHFVVTQLFFNSYVVLLFS